MKPRSQDVASVEEYCLPFELAAEPDIVIENCHAWLQDNDVRVVWKSVGRMSRSFKRRLVLDEESWQSKDAVDQAALMVHETAHCTRGFSRVAYLLSARRRWVEETIAFRAQARALRLMGRRLEDVLAWAKTIAFEEYRKTYLIFNASARSDAFRLIAPVRQDASPTARS